MKAQFIRQAPSHDLNLFFNGWSMDARTAMCLTSNRDLLAVWDYTTLDDLNLEEMLANYDKIYLIAWSLGVWAAAKFLETHPRISYASAIAINGTLIPISAQFGIAPEIFTGTAENWHLPPTQARFIQRMMGGKKDTENFPRSERSTQSQQNELRSLEHQIIQSPSPTNPYRLAIIGSRDRIFPATSQRAAWKLQNTPVVEIDAPHYPFVLYHEVELLGKLG